MAENQQKSEGARREEEILAFWKEKDIFGKALQKPSPKGEFVFYEGPPTANGRPGIHHLESRAFKDAVQRFRTMQGYHLRRKAGWDTHGLPVELEVEKELGIKNKKEIEAYGIAEFNKKCKESVLRYIGEWEDFSARIAFWYRDQYFTFDNDYIESVWNILKRAHERKLLYKDYKVVPWCPRCGTGLSSHEVAQGYQDDTPDPSVYVKFKAADANEYFLAWTTTPWTLPGNLALAVGADVDYVKALIDGSAVWLAKTRLSAIAPEAKIVEEKKGRDLVGRSYQPLFPYLAQSLPHSQEEALAKAYKVYAADFVSTEDGTGIVHTAVMYGADDFELGTAIGLPKYHLVGEDGKFLPAAGPLSGKFVKDADAEVIADLESRDLLFKKEIIKHTYPFCWRCKTPLIYYARDSWYIRMSALKEDLIKENQQIHWEPQHIRDGRFGEWLKDLKDWAISRSRYWGTPLPIWECKECGTFEVIGSVAELRKKTGGAALDLHRPYIDDFNYTCWQCEGQMARVPEVLDVWFDSGTMPFAQDHYPFEKKEWVKGAGYPADYICEAIDQTRGWFYTLHAVGGIMGRGRAFKNVICLGHILDAKGKKMSKSLGNIVVPSVVIDKYGVDALRFFMFTVNAPGDSKNFDERLVDEIVKKNIGRLNNVLSFYKLYEGTTRRDRGSGHVLDRWILARLDELVREASEGFEGYQLDRATRPISLFIDDLSVWYLRRSRDRFKEEGEDRYAALATLRYVLHTLSLVLAPSMPFFSEYLFQTVREPQDPESVHLAAWPEGRQRLGFFARLFSRGESDASVLSSMTVARDLVSAALEAREKAGLRIRQPLSKLTIPADKKVPAEYFSIIAEEVNVKKVEVGGTFALDTTLTEELREEGVVRDTLRLVQEARKAAKLKMGERGSVSITVPTADRAVVEKHLAHVERQTNTTVSLA
ncbi:MAG: isoleucine--tRNA ligase [Candidatus Kaiserbacteria bacterium]|nr:MAG: isoleucine--tRNA ligase [Candidatus Kaiserbacteria bacterium]